MVRIVDACQTLIVVIIGDELAFLCKVCSLLGQYIAECIVSETGDAACRMVYFRAAVTHVVSGCGNIALRVCDPYKSLDASYSKVVVISLSGPLCWMVSIVQNDLVSSLMRTLYFRIILFCYAF